MKVRKDIMEALENNNFNRNYDSTFKGIHIYSSHQQKIHAIPCAPSLSSCPKENYFTNASRSRITSNLLSRKPETVVLYTFMHQEYTLTESIGDSSATSSGWRRARWQWRWRRVLVKVVLENKLNFSLVATKIFCHQTLAEEKFVLITLYPIYYVCSIASFFLILKHYAISKFWYVLWPPFFL